MPLRIYLTRHTGKHRLERVQHMLSRLGYYDGPEDGQMGRKTWRAPVDFQLAAGLKPTGIIRGATLPVLETAFGIEETPRRTSLCPPGSGAGVRHAGPDRPGPSAARHSPVFHRRNR